MAIKCNYCGRYLSESELTLVKRKTPVSHKRRKTAIEIYHSSDSDIPELQTMKAGQKHQWLKLHKQEVEAYLEENGDAETRRHFGISRLDILPMMHSWQNITYKQEISDSDLKLNILQEEISLLKSEISDLLKRLPETIDKLPVEAQVKLYTFKLSEAVSKLQISTASEQLNIAALIAQGKDAQTALNKTKKINAYYPTKRQKLE